MFKIHIVVIFCDNYAQEQVLLDTPNTPNINTTYLKIRTRIIKIRLAKSKIRSYLIYACLLIGLLKLLCEHFYASDFSHSRSVSPVGYGKTPPKGKLPGPRVPPNPCQNPMVQMNLKNLSTWNHWIENEFFLTKPSIWTTSILLSLSVAFRSAISTRLLYFW